MLLHILFEFKSSPWGGANQFLRALRDQLRKQSSYRDNPNNADALIVNLNPGNLLPALKQVSKIKSRQPDKIIIARIDGPISLIRGRDDKLDRLLFSFINMFADGVIYQSHWSKKENNKIVQTKPPYETVIYNAAGPKIFYQIPPTPPLSRGALTPENQRPGKHPPPLKLQRTGLVYCHPVSQVPAPRSLKGEVGLRRPLESKIRLIATSWSPNIRKGFNIYQYLDQHLDFSRYDMTFVGNSLITFKNIAHVKPISSQKLASLLRQHDIYITASQNDPCSNALIEAISCGLPPVALAEGGHPELVQHGGELFTNQDDVIPKINLVAQNLPTYQANLSHFSITKAAQSYLNFARKINDDIQQDTYRPKHTNTLITKIKTAKIKALYYL